VVRKLELRGVAQQLATQSELLSVHEDDVVIKIELRIPVDTLISAGSVEKLATALTGYLNKKVSITTKIGVVRQTAHAASLAEQAERLQQAEQTLESDPFVQTLKREFGATIVPGSVRPI
jgi:DNA polymerase-3 subunit gamma/tau